MLMSSVGDERLLHRSKALSSAGQQATSCLSRWAATTGIFWGPDHNEAEAGLKKKNKKKH